jgi:hypothetical protein
MEFVIVTCDDQQRPVFVDNRLAGVTGMRIAVARGTHVLDLGASRDYRPASRLVDVRNTTAAKPRRVRFAPAVRGGARRASGTPLMNVNPKGEPGRRAPR